MFSSSPLIQANRLRCSFLVAFLSVFFIIQTASASSAFKFDTSKDTWAFLVGYGQSIPGWGQTTERVQTIDLVPRYDHVIFDNVGSGWLRGQYSTMVELPVHVVVSPVESAMVALNFLARYTFTADKNLHPYIFGGGGPVYSFADIPGMGAKWNGNYQFGLGIDRPISETHSVLVEIRYHHISNAGSAEPNVPLNSVKFLVGLTF